MISEKVLVDLTGLGRTPVREAIHRLAPSYMIRIHASKGIEIPAITVEDQLSRLEVRRAVEVLAVELACKRADENQRQAMCRLADVMNQDFTLQEYTNTIRDTHGLIIDAARNQYLGSIMLSVVVGLHERTDTSDKQDQELSRHQTHTHPATARRCAWLCDAVCGDELCPRQATGRSDP